MTASFSTDNPLGAHGLHHVALIASDYARSTDFYTRILGCTVIAEDYRAAVGGIRADAAVSGEQVVAPWDDPDKGARALTTAEVGAVVDDYHRAAVNAREAGFDYAEVHGAHGYLIHQFLSTSTNLRDDRYGGSTEDRARFALEVLEAVVSACTPTGRPSRNGSRHPQFCRTSGGRSAVRRAPAADPTPDSRRRAPARLSRDPSPACPRLPDLRRLLRQLSRRFFRLRNPGAGRGRA